MVDYMDENLVVYVEENLKTSYNNYTGWKLITGNSIKNSLKNSLSDNAYNSIKNRKNILLKECNTEIKRNETKYWGVEASKIISSSDDNLYENYTEILSSTSDVGRFYGEEKNGKWINDTPGNFDLTVNTHESDDNDYNNGYRAKFTIVPSTGDSQVIYYIIGISCLVVIAGGVVLIKKFVL